VGREMEDAKRAEVGALDPLPTGVEARHHFHSAWRSEGRDPRCLAPAFGEPPDGKL